MKLNRIIALTLAVLLIAVTGCAKPIPTASKDNIVRAEAIVTAGDWFDSINAYAKTDGGFIVAAIKYEYKENLVERGEIASYNYIIAKTDENGNLLVQTAIPTGTEENNYESVNFNSLLSGKDGEVYAIEQVNGQIDGVWASKSYLSKFNDDLSTERLVDINKALEKVQTDQYMYISAVELDDFGNVFVNTGMQVYGINIESGELMYSQLQSENGYTQGMIKMDDGKVGIIMVKFADVDGYSQMRTVLIPIDPKTGKEGDDVLFPGGSETSRSDNNTKYSYYYVSPAYIFGYNEGDAEMSVAADLMKSGIADINFGNSKVIAVDDSNFILQGTDTITAKTALYRLTLIPPEEIPDKKLISAAGIGADHLLSNYIRKFNQESEEFQVDYKSFSFGAANTDYMTEFNTAILAGNTFDIMDINSQMPYNSYVSKGLFVDLNEYIDKDPEIKREDFVSSILEATETDGKLYSLVTGYSINTLSGKTEIFGNTPGISLSRMLEIQKNYPDSSLLGKSVTQELFLQNMLYYSFDDYLDYQTGETRFNTPEFITLLETAKTYPKEIDYQNYDYSTEEALYAKDLTLLNSSYIGGFKNFQYSTIIFGAPISFLGYPNSKGESGIVAMPRYEFAIMKNTPNPDGAWDFIKGFAAYEGPLPIGNVIYSSEQLSVLKSQNEALAKEATEPPYYYDQNGVKRYHEGYGSYMTVGGENFEIGLNTDEDNALIYSAIDNVSSIFRYDRKLWDIILEDTEPFFNGNKSAEETAAIIDNRIKTYVQESM
jgi:ABC-type glycerol-3-phosphate transport system substrate-binding protein